MGKKLSCTSSNQKEGKLAFYSEGDVKAYLADTSDASKLGEKKPLKDGVSLGLGLGLQLRARHLSTFLSAAAPLTQTAIRREV